jgi:hypothetical protein
MSEFAKGGTVTVWPVCEPDPVETTFPGVTFGDPVTANIVHIPSPHKPTTDLWLSLVQAITEQTKAINALVEQNQMLIQAMAGEEGVEEVDRYQTL